MPLNYIYNRDEDRHHLIKETNMSVEEGSSGRIPSLPALISPKEIAEYPTDPYRIIPLLDEIRRVWDNEPGKTLCQILLSIIEPEFTAHDIYNLSDDEFLAALQNYRSKS